MGSKAGRGGGIEMKKLYGLLKYIIYGSLYVIVFKTGFDFYNYKKYPNVYAYYSAPCPRNNEEFITMPIHYNNLHISQEKTLFYCVYYCKYI